ncbi:hypothetical protein K5962_27745, partial [Klebsiella pneumoniae]|uniref:hypothetical protein n=1 Tax=Klebsiella pneumoniae TaxID=573 RepID=UPI001C8B186D
MVIELLKKSVTISLIKREKHRFNFFRAIIKSPLFISYRPKTSKQKSPQRMAFCKLIISEKAWFDISGSGHL